MVGLARGHAWALGSEPPGGGITGTIHDFTAGGHFGATVAVGQCTFCHTPHGAISTSLLWNHTLSGQTYSWDDTATMAGTPFPTFADTAWKGPTAKCLSCHDGTVAVSSVNWFDSGHSGGFAGAGPHILGAATGHASLQGLSNTNTLILQGFYETISPGGHLDYYAVETSPTYTHSIPWGGTLTLGTDGRYEIDQDHTQGPVTVLDEKHTAPSFFGPGIGFTLANRFVVTSTIVMYDTHGGGRLLTRLGVDYDLVAQGQLTQIVIIPTTVKIHPGDPLEVSYSYVAGPNGQYSTTAFGANAGVAFGWIALNFSHQQLKQSLQSGIGAQYLYSFHQENAQLDVHKEWEWFEARGMALYQIYHTQSQASGAFDYTLQNYGEFLTFRPPWTWSTNTTIHLDGSETFIDYTLQPTRQNTDLNFEASLDRFFSSGNYFTAFARARQITQTDFQTETDYEVGMRGNFRYGKIYIWPWLSWIERSYGPTKVNDPHIMLRIGRDL